MEKLSNIASSRRQARGEEQERKGGRLEKNRVELNSQRSLFVYYMLRWFLVDPVDRST